QRNRAPFEQPLGFRLQHEEEPERCRDRRLVQTARRLTPFPRASLDTRAQRFESAGHLRQEPCNELPQSRLTDPASRPPKAAPARALPGPAARVARPEAR